MLGDLHFTCGVVELALAASNHGVPTYYYMFSHRASEQSWPAWMGVLHGYEIPFIFGEPLNTGRFKYTNGLFPFFFLLIVFFECNYV
jgi:carboxylesterase type B